MAGRSKILITGIDGFTGRHLKNCLQEYDCIGLKADLLDKDALELEIFSIKPDYVIHLAGRAFVADVDISQVYNVNVLGTLNLLEALSKLKTRLKKVILSSSASVYGDLTGSSINESTIANPVNHYGCSKLSMEYVSKNYLDRFPIIITRPFNYTGRGHSVNFLIPKIVNAYRERRKKIELGNLDVYREFNDVRDVCAIYRLLLDLNVNYLTINICSGKTISLLKVIELMNNLTGFKMDVRVNSKYVRKNEIRHLSGDASLLKKLISFNFRYSLEETLRWMM